MMLLWGLWLTIAVYIAAKFVYRRSPCLALSPLLVCPVLLIAILAIWKLPLEQYHDGGRFLSLMLQPATVALAVPLYKHKAMMRSHMVEIAAGVAAGSVAAIISTVGLAQILGLAPQLAESMAPRSITTPMAVGVSEMLGGDPGITAVFVIITGISGVFITSLLLKWAPIHRPVTRGMLYGIVAHATGTARACELGALEGAAASLSMIFMGILTTLLAPTLVPACMQWFGQVGLW